LTDKDLLPVTGLNFGHISSSSNGKYSLGMLECRGQAMPKAQPTNCADLSLLGHQLIGYYLVKDPSSNRIQTVHCDFNQSPSDRG